MSLLTPRLHQIDGAIFLEDRPRAYLNWKPRVGKTGTSLMAADNVGAKRVLIVCPAIAKETWKRDLARWGNQRPVVTLDKNASCPRDVADPNVVVICNYDILSREDSVPAAVLAKLDWDVVIFDEAHYLKTGGSGRTKSCIGKNGSGGGILKRAARAWFLSGTPTPNHYGELFSVLRAAGPAVFRAMNKSQFENQFCRLEHNGFGLQIAGSQNGAELRALMDGFMDFKSAEDVGLPSVQYDVLPLTVDMLTKADMAPVLDALKVLSISIPADPEKLKSLPVGHMAVERRILGLAKAKLVARIVDEEIRQTSEKRILFAHHKDVIATLADALKDHHPAIVTGETAPKARTLARDRFMTDPACMSFIGNTQAASTNLDLSITQEVISVEPSFVPGENIQAANRANSLTSTAPVFMRFATFAGTYDERIQEILIRKATDLSELHGSV